jgi:hypothetical protein
MGLSDAVKSQDPFGDFSPPADTGSFTGALPPAPAALPPSGPPAPMSSQQAFDPSGIDAAYARGALNDTQYRAMGGILPRSAGGIANPAAPPPGMPAPPAPPGAGLPPAAGPAAPGRGVPYAPPGAGGPVPPGAAPGLTQADYMKAAMAGGGGPARSGFVPSTRSSEGTDSPVRDELVKATGEELGANRELAAAQLDPTGSATARRAEDIRAAYDQAQALQDKVRADAMASELGTYRDHVNTALQDAAKGDIPQSKLWGNASTAQKIAGTIGIALQGFVWGLTGHGPSPAEVINGMIQRNAESQAQKARERRAAVGDAQSAYEFNKQALGDHEASLRVTEAAQRASVMATLDRQVADAQAPAEVRVRAATIRAQLAKTQRETVEGVDKTLQTKVSTSDRYQQAGGGTDLLGRINRGNEAFAKDLANRKTEQEIAAAGGAKPEDTRAIATSLAQAGVPESEAAIDRVDRLIAKGGAERSVLTLGLPRQTAVGGLVGNVAAGADARELHSALTDLAVSKLKSEGARMSPELIHETVGNLMGNGTEDDIRRNVDAVREQVKRARAGIEAGATPSTAATYEGRRQDAGAARPPGFIPAGQQ